MWFVGHEISIIVGYAGWLDQIFGVPIFSAVVRAIEGDHERQEAYHEQFGGAPSFAEDLRTSGALGFVDRVTHGLILEPFQEYVMPFYGDPIKGWWAERVSPLLSPLVLPFSETVEGMNAALEDIGRSREALEKEVIEAEVGVPGGDVEGGRPQEIIAPVAAEKPPILKEEFEPKLQEKEVELEPRSLPAAYGNS